MLVKYIIAAYGASLNRSWPRGHLRRSASHEHWALGPEARGSDTQFGDTYRDSRLSRNLDYATTIPAGDLAPSAPIVQAGSGETRRLFDLFRSVHFTLLTFSARHIAGFPAIPDLLRVYIITRPGLASATESEALINRDGDAYRAYGVTKDALALVRADGYVSLSLDSSCLLAERWWGVG
jgi:hypothetical protein